MKHHHSRDCMIVIRNDSQWVGNPNYGGLGVYLDGRHAGVTYPYGGDLKVPVAPGRHTVRIRWLWYFSPRVKVDLPRAGSDVHLRANMPTTGPILARLLKVMVRPLHSLLLEETGQTASR